MTSSYSGLLLLLVGFFLFAGFVTGNLWRWMDYLFNPSRPSMASASSAAPGSTAGTTAGSVGSSAAGTTVTAP